MDQGKVREQIAAFCTKNQLYCSVRLTYRDQVLFSEHFGYANKDFATPITDDSVFTLYSLSKPFCAIGLLLLCDKGLVDLDEHPGAYLDEVKALDPRITVRQLLQHTSGAQGFHPIMDAHLPGYAHKLRPLLPQVAAQPVLFEPGKGALYTNIGYIIAALIIENISGLPYSEYMKKYVFEPLGMKTATVDHEKLTIPNRVSGHVLVDGVPTPVGKSHDWLFGAGDIVGRVEDVYCLNHAIKHKLLLKPETWEKVLTPSPLNNKGLGCTVTKWHGKTRITHNGGHKGFRTIHIQLPEDDFDIIVLSNSGYTDEGRSEIAEILYRAFYDESAVSEKPLDMDTGYI